MNWRKNFDKYLTSPPDNDGEFNEYYELVIEEFSDDFYYFNEDWILISTTQFDKWLNRVYDKGLFPKDGAKLIERAFKFYKLKP